MKAAAWLTLVLALIMGTWAISDYVENEQTKIRHVSRLDPLGSSLLWNFVMAQVNRDEDKERWDAVVGLLAVGALIGAIVLFSKTKKDKAEYTSPGELRPDAHLKKCPQCAEFVQPDAKICRFCQHKFEEEKPAEPPKELTELEQLVSQGMSAGPPCPKCGSVSTFSQEEPVKSSRWWKNAEAAFLHCRKCGETWQPQDSVPVESLKVGIYIGIWAMVLAVVITVFFVYATHEERNGNASVPSSVFSADTERFDKAADEKHTSIPQSKWNKSTAAAIKQHCALVGMTKEEVDQALGKPTKVTNNSTTFSSGDIWEYEYQQGKEALYFSPKGHLKISPSQNCVKEPFYSRYRDLM